MTSLNYKMIGNGPPLIILHGLYGMSDNWMGIARMIQDKFTVILPDLRNHGKSFHSNEHNYTAMADDVEMLAKELGIKKFFLAGHSMGGKSAMYYSFKYPQNLYGLIVIDIAPVNYETTDHHFAIHHHILKSLNSVSPQHFESRQQAFEALESLIPDEKLLNFLLKNLTKDQEGKFIWSLNIPALINNMNEIALGFDEDKVPSPVSGFPVLFIKGSKSNYINEEYFEQMKKIYPAYELEIIENAGHWLHQEQAEQTANAIFKILNL